MLIPIAPKVDCFMVESRNDFVNLKFHVEQLVNPGPFVLDVETDSKIEKLAKLHGIGLSFRDGEAFYIPIRDNQKERYWAVDQEAAIYAWVAELAEKLGWVGYNAVFDTLVFEYNSGFDITPYLVSDPILQKHALNEERPFGLKEVSVQYLGPWADKSQKLLHENIRKNGGKTTKEQMDMWKADTDVLADYCGWDVILTRMLWRGFDKRLLAEGTAKLFYDDETMPLYRECTIPMKRHGFPVDVGYFEFLNTEILQDISTLEKSIIKDIGPLVQEFSRKILDDDCGIKRKGNFPKYLAKVMKLSLPEKEDGKITLAAKAINEAHELQPHPIYAWMLGDDTALSMDFLKAAQVLWYKEKNPDREHVFNLGSPNHLRYLFFTKLGIKPISKTDSGEPSVDEDTLDELRGQHQFVDKIIDYRKLKKLQGTYIGGILSRQIDGVIYTSYLQFGTPSGRYASRDPNLQNLPRVKDEEAELSPLVLKYTNAIKKGFIAPKGFKIVNADYSSLEPVCFAHMSGDEKLRDVFRKGHDLYSAIAIDVFGLKDCSADKKAANYLKKLYPEKRQLAKIFCLAVVYGAEAGRIASAMNIEYAAAQIIIDSYLAAYPNLEKYMRSCEKSVMEHGFVETSFGRKRHLPHIPEMYKRYGNQLFRRQTKPEMKELRYKFKHALNLSKNFGIQGLAGHIVNRAAIAAVRSFRAEGLDVFLVAQTHDELSLIAKEAHSERVAQLLKKAMEHTTTISVPLIAEPIIADNWAAAK